MTNNKHENGRNKVSEQYFVNIVQEEKDLMFRLAYNIMQNTVDAEDVVAESICKAWEKRKSLKNPDKMRNWILRIIINTAKNAVAVRNRIELVEDFPQYCDEQENKNNIWDLVSELKEKERTVIILYYYRGFSVREVSKILHIPEGTVKSRLSNARNNLKKLM